MTTTMMMMMMKLTHSSDWLKQVFLATRPIRSACQIWVITGHQYGISSVVAQTSCRGETSGGVANCRLFSQIKHVKRPVPTSYSLRQCCLLEPLRTRISTYYLPLSPVQVDSTLLASDSQHC